MGGVRRHCTRGNLVEARIAAAEACEREAAGIRGAHWQHDYSNTQALTVPMQQRLQVDIAPAAIALQHSSFRGGKMSLFIHSSSAVATRVCGVVAGSCRRGCNVRRKHWR